MNEGRPGGRSDRVAISSILKGLASPARSVASSMSALRAYFIFCVIMTLNTSGKATSQLQSRAA